MKVKQKCIKDIGELETFKIDFNPQLLLLFVSPEFKDISTFATQLKKRFPNAILMGCSTAGEINDIEVVDNSVVLNAISFEHTKLRYQSVNLADYEDSVKAGLALSKALAGDELKHIVVLSDGLNVNGADLVLGLNQDIDDNVSITGGLAGDSADFKSTFLIDNGEVVDGRIIGLGLYGSKLKVGYGSKGGWDSFGVERMVTKSDKNILYELDGEPALKLYKSFLGDKAKDLPGSGLLFPLSMRGTQDEPPVVRTILAVDEATQSLTFAGNLPEGNYVRLMKANIDRLITGAEDSAEDASRILKDEAKFALLISCVGRRLVLKQMVEEELEVVRDHLGRDAIMSGFYSYGEIAPFGEFSSCRLHNQTMTITTFAE